MPKRKHCHVRIMRDVDRDVISSPDDTISPPSALALSLSLHASLSSSTSSCSSAETASPIILTTGPLSPVRERSTSTSTRERATSTASTTTSTASTQQTNVDAEAVPTQTHTQTHTHTHTHSPISISLPLSPVSHASSSPRSPSSSSSPMSTPSPTSKKRRLRRLAFSVVVDPSDNPDMNLMRHLSLSVVNVSPKRKAHKLNTFLATHPLFTSLTPDCRRQVYNEMVLEMFPANTCIYRITDVNDKFYVIESGSIQITQDETYPEPHIKHEGDTLGDLSLWQPANKENTATCITDTRCYSIDGGLFRFLISSANQTRYTQLQRFYHDCGWLSSTFLTSNQLERLIDATDILEFTSGDIILPTSHTHTTSSQTTERNRSRSHSSPTPHDISTTHVFVVKEGKVVVTTTRHHNNDCKYYNTTTSASTSTSIDTSTHHTSTSTSIDTSTHQSIRTDILGDEAVFGLPLIMYRYKSPSTSMFTSPITTPTSSSTSTATSTHTTSTTSPALSSSQNMSLSNTSPSLISSTVSAPSPCAMILASTPTHIPNPLSLSVSIPTSSITHTSRSSTSSSVFTFQSSSSTWDDTTFIVPTLPSTSSSSLPTSTCTCPTTLHATCSSPAAILLSIDWSILSSSLLIDVQHALVRAYHTPTTTSMKNGFQTGAYTRTRPSPRLRGKR